MLQTITGRPASDAAVAVPVLHLQRFTPAVQPAAVPTRTG